MLESRDSILAINEFYALRDTGGQQWVIPADTYNQYFRRHGEALEFAGLQFPKMGFIPSPSGPLYGPTKESRRLRIVDAVRLLDVLEYEAARPETRNRVANALARLAQDVHLDAVQAISRPVVSFDAEQVILTAKGLPSLLQQVGLVATMALGNLIDVVTFSRLGLAREYTYLHSAGFPVGGVDDPVNWRRIPNDERVRRWAEALDVIRVLASHGSPLGKKRADWLASEARRWAEGTASEERADFQHDTLVTAHMDTVIGQLSDMGFPIQTRNLGLS